LLAKVLPRDRKVEGFRVDHDFPSIGPRSMVLNGRRVEGDHGAPPFILLSVSEVAGKP
jgi:hypothetical protein